MLLQHKTISKIRVILFLSVASLSCNQSKPIVDADKERIEKVCGKIMEIFVTGKTDAALDLLKQNTVMHASTVDTLAAKINLQKQTTFPQFGKMNSFEFAKEKKINNTISKRFYVIKFTHMFLIADFTLYKTDKGWVITSFHYIDEPDAIFD